MSSPRTTKYDTPREHQQLRKVNAARTCKNPPSIVKLSFMSFVTRVPPKGGAFEPAVAFHRTELSVILQLYGRMVAAGEWRDYGISHLRDVAIFSVFRRAAEHPMYRIEKRPKLKGRQGQYLVMGMDGRILKRGDDLRTVLRVLERKLIRAVD